MQLPSFAFLVVSTGAALAKHAPKTHSAMGSNMTISNLTDFATIIGPLLTGLSVVFGVVYFTINLKRDRATKTLDFWEEVNRELKNQKSDLRKNYGETIGPDLAESILEDDDEQAKINRVLNIYERLALGANLKAYDVRVLNKLVGQNIIDNYRRFEAYIEARRHKLDRPFAWREFQSLVEKLERLRRKSSTRPLS